MKKIEDFEQTSEAFALFATEHLKLEAIVQEQARDHLELEATLKALGELVRAQDTQIRALVKLVDIHQQVLVDAGLARPRPTTREKGRSRFEN